MNYKYDYIIIGCGLFGITFAREMTNYGKKCLIIDKRNHIGGNIYSEKINGINIHKYGPHIFHTSNKEIWDYVNKYSKFNNFIYEPIAIYKNKLYNLPFNMNTFYQMWGVKSPKEAKDKIESQILKISNPKNIEEFALSKVGKDIYKKLIYGYTFKQWDKNPKELPEFIIKRIPLRFVFNNNYFDDTYQGIPINGYTDMVKNLIENIEVKLNVNFLDNKSFFEKLGKKIIYTGKIDEFFNYEFGELEYRSLKFENEILNIPDFQGNAVVNYTEKNIPWTRIIEHKHFEKKICDSTIITKEFPQKYNKFNEPYYPVNNNTNNSIYELYKEKSKTLKNYLFGGRLGSYKYYDMHQIIGSALLLSKKENNL